MAQLRPRRVGFAMASTTKSQTRKSQTRVKRKAAKAADEQPSGIAANWRSWLLAALLIAGVIVAVLHWGDVKKFAALVTHAKPLWLLAAVGAQVLTYVSLAIEWTLVLRMARCRSPFGKLLGLTVAKHFADQMVPTAGMSGNVVLVDRLKEISGSRPVALGGTPSPWPSRRRAGSAGHRAH